MNIKDHLRLAAFASPVTPVTTAFIPMVLLLPGLYAQDFGFDVAVVGGALVFARLIDAISDPMIGLLSDHTKSRFGRRRPWIVLGGIGLVLSTLTLFAPQEPPGIVALYFTIICFYISWTMVFIPHQAWGIDLVSSYGERTKLNVYLGLFNTLGVFLSLLIPFFFLSQYGYQAKAALFGWAMNGNVDLPERIDRILNFSGQGAVPFTEIMFLLAIVISVLIPVTLTLAMTTQKEPINKAAGMRLGFRSTLSLLTRNKPFNRMVLGNFFMQVSLQLWSAAQPFYLIYILGLPNEFLLLLIINQGFALITVPVWGWIAFKLGRGRALAVAGLLMATGFALLHTIPTASLAFAIAPYLVLGAASDGKWMLPIGLAGDAADYDNLKNKRNEPALHMATLFLTNKIGIAFGGVTLILFGVIGFQPGTENSQGALLAMKYISTGLPFLFSLAGAAVMWNFPITAKRHNAIEKRLRRREAHDMNNQGPSNADRISA